MRDQHLYRTRRDAADAFCFAAIPTENELVEVGLQVARFDRACVRTHEPALQHRHRPVRSLERVCDSELESCRFLAVPS